MRTMWPRSVTTVKLPPSTWWMVTRLPAGSFTCSPYGIWIASTSRFSAICSRTSALASKSRYLAPAHFNVPQLGQIFRRDGRPLLRAMLVEDLDQASGDLLRRAALDLRPREHGRHLAVFEKHHRRGRRGRRVGVKLAHAIDRLAFHAGENRHELVRDDLVLERHPDAGPRAPGGASADGVDDDQHRALRRRDRLVDVLGRLQLLAERDDRVGRIDGRKGHGVLLLIPW